MSAMWLIRCICLFMLSRYVQNYRIRVLSRRGLGALGARTKSNSIFAEGATVELTEGGQAQIVRFNKGWYTLSVVDPATRENRLVKARASALVPQPDAIQQKLNLATKDYNTDDLQSSQTSLVPTFPLSGPSSFNIAKVVAPEGHERTRSWIIFSDLHVKSSSIDTCEQVLDRVHAEAVKQNAGIIFLGDFWHVRGALNVELLNRVMKCLRRYVL